MKKIFIAVFLIGILITMIGCTSKSSDTIKIGSILFLTNNDISVLGVAMQEGIDLAVEELNNEGGVLGKQIQIIHEDDELDITKAVNSANKLANIDQVDVALLGLVNTGKASGEIFKSKQIPAIVLFDTNKELEKLGDYIYGIGFNTEEAGYVMAEMLYTKKGVRTVAIINHFDEWSTLISNSFKERFEALGGTVIVKESLEIGETNFRTTITKAKDADAIYAPLVGDLDVFFKQAKELGYNGIITTGDSLTKEAIDNAKGAAENVYFTNVDVKENTRLERLKKAYSTKYNKESDLIVFNALGYDSVMVVAEAIKIAKSNDPKAIHDALYKVKDYQGAAGKVTINEKGFAPKFEKIFIVKDGEMERVE